MSTLRRGRPKASTLPDLIRAGELGNSSLKCEFCNRTFPRTKSLAAHRRIHTDEKPYDCTYPQCYRSFRQSGQLKTHVRRHTGEKPFACPEIGCPQRFIHSSRRCPKHPGLDLKKDDLEQIYLPENLSEEELKWFEEYKQNKGKPAKRKSVATSEEVKKQKIEPEKYENHRETSSSSGVSSDGFCSETSTDDNYYPQEKHEVRENIGQYNCIFFTRRPRNPEDIEAAEILCSFSKRAK